jgi:hypothetical protein
MEQTSTKSNSPDLAETAVAGAAAGHPLPVTLNTTTDKTLSGWAAGGGVEYGIDMGIVRPCSCPASD